MDNYLNSLDTISLDGSPIADIDTNIDTNICCDDFLNHSLSHEKILCVLKY